MMVSTAGVIVHNAKTYSNPQTGGPYYGGTALPNPQTIALSTALLQKERIVIDPAILDGAPHIRGTRIPIAVILDGLDEGLTYEELIEHYPRLMLEDIRSAREYAASKALNSGD